MKVRARGIGSGIGHVLRSLTAAVELAPSGRMEGSVFLPRVPDAQALAVDFSYEGAARRVMLPVPRPAGR